MTQPDAPTPRAADPRQRRRLAYGLMLLASFLAPIADSLNGTAYAMQITPIDVVMMVLYIALTAWWCAADARLHDYEGPGGGTRILVILIFPLGLALYLFRRRAPGRAALLWLGFCGGLLLATVVGGQLGDLIVPPNP